MNKYEKTAEANRSRTATKVRQALEQLMKENREFTVKDVAKAAGVSVKTLYNREELLLEVKQQIEIKHAVLNPTVSKPKPMKEQQLERANELNDRLSQENRHLLDQNVQLTLEVTRLRNLLAEKDDYIRKLTDGKLVKIDGKRK